MRVSLSVFCLAAAAAVPAFAVEPEAPETLIERADAIRILTRNEAERQANAKVPQRLKATLKDMARFYESRGGEPLWIENGAFTEKRDGVITVLSRAGEFGMDPEDYAAPEALDLAGAEFPAERIARAEIEMSAVTLQYAVHAQAGRFVPQDLSEYLDPSPDIPAAGEVLGWIAENNGDVEGHLEGFQPQNPQFKALRAELLRQQGGEGVKPVVAVPARGPYINPGDRHADVAAIRERLGAPMPLEGESADFYDSVLADAVRAFQERSNLSPDGIVGPSTRNAFYVPPPPSKDVLIANMERWRWFPRSLGDTYVRVNIPEFLVRIIENDQATFEERIVVGKPQNQTVVFSDQMETVVLNPFWNVPGSITLKEILPIVRRNPSYLERNNLQVFITGHRRPVDPWNVNWDAINPNKVFIRQPPGDDNALGNVKFLFPNKHAIYMHDTPTKHLFNQRSRAYSHGCMRVRNPRNFAEALLRNQGWSLRRINQTIASGKDDVNVRVAARIPVHIMYFTLWANEDGGLRRFSDIYDHDDRVIAALQNARS